MARTPAYLQIMSQATYKVGSHQTMVLATTWEVRRLRDGLRAHCSHLQRDPWAEGGLVGCDWSWTEVYSHDFWQLTKKKKSALTLGRVQRYCWRHGHFQRGKPHPHPIAVTFAQSCPPFLKKTLPGKYLQSVLRSTLSLRVRGSGGGQPYVTKVRTHLEQEAQRKRRARFRSQNYGPRVLLCRQSSDPVYS